MNEGETMKEKEEEEEGKNEIKETQINYGKVVQSK